MADIKDYMSMAHGHLNGAREGLKRGDFDLARMLYQKCEWSWKNVVKLDPSYQNDLDRIQKEYSEFAKTDPLYIKLLALIKDVASNKPGILQTEMYSELPDYNKSDISYVLFFAEKHKQIIRHKKGRTYQLELSPDCKPSVPVPPPPPTSVKEQIITDSMFCMNCGVKIPITANFCRKCGTKVIKTEPATNLDVPKFEVKKAEPVPPKKRNVEIDKRIHALIKHQGLQERRPDLGEEIDKSMIAGMMISNALDSRVCPFCLYMGGGKGSNVPMAMNVNDDDFDLMEPPFHKKCRCFSVYIMKDQVGVETWEWDYKRPPDEIIKEHAPYVWERIQVERGK
ncbi:MAG: zinc ribbon domain-containing protein [bacterium]